MSLKPLKTLEREGVSLMRRWYNKLLKHDGAVWDDSHYELQKCFGLSIAFCIGFCSSFQPYAFRLALASYFLQHIAMAWNFLELGIAFCIGFLQHVSNHTIFGWPAGGGALRGVPFFAAHCNGLELFKIGHCILYWFLQDRSTIRFATGPGVLFFAGLGTPKP